MSCVNMSLSYAYACELQAMCHGVLTCKVTPGEDHIPVMGGDFTKLHLFGGL